MSEPYIETLRVVSIGRHLLVIMEMAVLDQVPGYGAYDTGCYLKLMHGRLLYALGLPLPFYLIEKVFVSGATTHH